MKKFYENIMKTETGCWEWVGPTSNGYGMIFIDGVSIGAHRFSYMLHCDEIPEGMSVLHTCDYGLCVNPSHLFAGTQADNMRDKVSKNRQAKGRDNGNSKLTVEQVLQIRQLLNENTYYQFEIARLYDVDPKTITNIKLRRQWRHI